MNRARANNVVLHTLFYALLLLFASSLVSAQINRSRNPRSIAASRAAAASKMRSATPHQFISPHLTQVPAYVTRGHYRGHIPGQAGRAVGDTAVFRQTTLLTKQNPGDQNSFVPAPSQDEHPFASADEKYIYFDSDRADDTTTPQTSTGVFNIYRMFPDGSGVTKITSGTDNKIEPAVSQDGSRVAYASGGNYTNLAANLDNPPTSGFNLYFVDLSSGGNPVSLTANNASGITFVDVRHPTWSAGGDKIAFAGKTNADPGRYHIFIVTVQNDQITQMTSGTSNDYAPAWSPDGRLIAFTTNAGGFNPGAAPITTSGIVPTDDIYVLNPNPVTPNPARVTGFSVGTKQSTNKNPAWSTLRPDPLQIVPPETNTNGDIVSAANLLAFASNRADTNHDGVANDVVNTFDIYWLRASIKPDPVLAGSYTVTTPESSTALGNHALKLRTSTPDTAIDPNDPTSMFDPNFVSNEDYPTWPQYINSYRISFQSDRGLTTGTIGSNLNIWAATIFDINAPTLLKYDIPSNEIVHIGRETPGNPQATNVAVRELNAGETIRMKVRVVDYESGVESVWAQIKNPNSSPQSADNTEHKTYFVGPGFLDSTNSVINAPYELDAQAINPATNSFRNPEAIPNNYIQFNGRQPTGWPGWNMYIAGIDDANALTGSSNPPDDDTHDYTQQGGFWLPLYDDGPVSAGGHEPEGEVKGDGIWTNTWQTPISLPSDWYIDIIVRDNAVDPFAPTERTNWKIYDNVWGFTTQPFIGKGQFLYVNDYDIGQRFFQTHFGTGTTFAPDFFSFSKTFSGYPTESWMTEIDPALIPTTVFDGTNVDPLVNFLTPLGQNSYGQQGGFNTDPTVQDGTNIPVTGSYDQWRILSRGPVPDSVLTAYRGHIESQPADVIAGGTGPRQVTVAERAIIWHAPYTGDLFVGPGTLLDTDTQLRLANFVKNGGRLFLNGNDIAYGLTLSQGGGGINPFLNQTMHVTYSADNYIPPVVNPQMTPVVSGGVGGRGFHPIVTESFYNLIEHRYPIPPPTPNDPPGTGPIFLASVPGTVRDYMCLNGDSNDVVLFTAPINSPDKSDVDAFYSGGSVTTTPSVMWVTDTSNAPFVSKVVFSPFGWEQINPEYFVQPNSTIRVLKNRRVEMLHNVGDYLRTGRIVGNVRDVNGATPLSRVFIRAISPDPNIPAANQVAATTLSQADGSYVLNGLDANGIYAIDAVKKGFITQHIPGGFFHGGWQTRVDIFLTPAQPGSISGTVTQLVGGAPVPGVIVVAQSKTDPTSAPFTATTDVNGKYTIQNVPADIYIVSTPLSSPGNLTSLGYGASVPPSYGGPEAGAAAAVTVGPAQNVTGIDFKLKQAPGRILGKVTDATNGQPISGATVTATNTNGTFTANTAADGTYVITGVDPGIYAVTGSSPGYAPNTVPSIAVTSGQDTINVNIALNPVPPGSLSGLVASSNGVPIGGATVTVSKLDGTQIATTTTGAVQTVGTYSFNYKFTDSIPAGAKVNVTASKTGFTNKTGTLTVGPINSDPPGPETTGVNFTLDPLHTYPNTLTLVSAPYEVPTDVTLLFGIPQADVANKSFAFIWWDTTKNQYVSYPTPPADTFHLGKGYFMQEVNTAIALALTQAGTPAPTTQKFAIPLQAGWNLIGDPFPTSFNFLTQQVQEADGSIKDVLTAQTGSNPSLGAALWTYENGNYEVVFTLDAYRGYWIRAFRPVTLLIDPTTSQTRATASQMRSLLDGNAQGSGWKLQMVASAGNTRSAPSILGVHAAATNDYDLFKLEAPPAVGPQNLSLTFDHPEWAAKAGKYSVDVRSVAATQQKWNVLLTSSASDQPIILNWPGLATIPGKYDVMLTDEDSHTTINLRTHANYTIPAGRSAGPTTRHFTVQVQRAQRPTLALTEVTAILNRSQGRAATAANISYQLTGDATVQVTIKQNGRPIRSVEQGTTRAAGSSQTVWDLRDDKGAQVPGNLYTVEVRASDAAGHVVRRETPLLITR